LIIKLLPGNQAASLERQALTNDKGD